MHNTEKWGSPDVLIITHNSPFEDVLGDVHRCGGVPLDGVGVGLFPRLCDDDLDWSVAV